MANKTLANTYELPNGEERMERDELIKALTDFEYLTGHYMQIVSKDRRLVPFKLNAAQKYIFKTLWPMIDPKTRLDRHRSVVMLKGRQLGASVSIIAFVNYILAYAKDIENMSIIHILPITDTFTRLATTKVEPIITGIHPDIFPTIWKQTMGSSIVYNYENVQGVPRNNRYELVSSNTSSIRSSTNHVALFDECYSGNVEVLTDSGFKRFDELDHTERVAQFNIENREISFVKPLRFIERKHSGEAFEWNSEDKCGRFSFVTTSRHNFVVLDKETQDFEFVEAKDLHPNHRHLMATWGVGCGDNSKLTAIERLGIAVQADGYVLGQAKRTTRASSAVGETRCTVTLSRRDKIQNIEALLVEAGIKWTKKIEKTNHHVYRFSLPIANPKKLSTFLKVDCSHERAKDMLYEILLWDGHGVDRRKNDRVLPRVCYYSSIDKENRDFVAAIALQAGMRCSASIEKDNRSSNYHDVYRLNMTMNKNTSYRVLKKKCIYYNDKVYCVTVPTGAIVVKTGSKVWVCGNCSYYSKPQDLEDIVNGSLPDYGFSLSVYFSTFGEKHGANFLAKIQTAIDNPDEMDLIFVPWFLSYPEVPLGTNITEMSLDEYEMNTIIPALEKFEIPKEQWGDKITWYRRKKISGVRMQLEFPTTIEEVLGYGENSKVFSQEAIEYQKSKVESGMRCTIMTDNITRQVKAVETEEGSFRIYRRPIYGHKYIEVVDPITSISEDSDYFAMSIFDIKTLEQVATFREKELSVEDYADICVSAAKIYNKAQICPERNVAEGLVACIRASGYYNFWYESNKAKAKKEPGLRTTYSNKNSMIEKLIYMLDSKTITLHDAAWVDELQWFEKKTKTRRGGGTSVTTMAARKGKHDDTVMVLAIFAGTLNQNQLSKKKSSGYGILW